MYPAGVTLRQAHRRHPNPYGFMDAAEAIVLEQVLNLYGIASDCPTFNDIRFKNLPNPKCQRINLQRTFLPHTLVDFNFLHADSRPWPRSDDISSHCLVHWLGTHLIIDKQVGHQLGNGTETSWAVRNFLLQDLLMIDGGGPTMPARAGNRRLVRHFEAVNEWWHGRMTANQVEGVLKEGMVNGILDSYAPEVAEKQSDEL